MDWDVFPPNLYAEVLICDVTVFGNRVHNEEIKVKWWVPNMVKLLSF